MEGARIPFFGMQVWRGAIGCGVGECGYRGCRAVGEREAPHDAEGLRGTVTTMDSVLLRSRNRHSRIPLTSSIPVSGISHIILPTPSPTHIKWCDAWSPTLKTHSLPCSQASESRLYTVSTPTKEHLRKFRLSTSRSDKPQAVICTLLAAFYPFLISVPSPLHQSTRSQS